MKKFLYLMGALVACLVVVGGAAGAGSWVISSGSQIKDGVIPASKLTDNAIRALSGADGSDGARGPRGLKGADGSNGANGVNGVNGKDGAAGAQGAQGPKGATGSQGPQGPQGPAGVNASTDYGVAGIRITRGANTAQWATYSTLLGSPVGDTTGGVFRFTCHANEAPCSVAVVAASLGAGSLVYPRVIVTKDGSPSGGAASYTGCEYADGSTGAAPLALTGQASSSTPTYTAVPVNIGGTADCGLGGPAGDVAAILVPEGYYDVHSTFVFVR